MSTKKGYILFIAGRWGIGEKCTNLNAVYELERDGEFYNNIVEVHPDSLHTILSNGSLKPAYQGEVGYEEVEVEQRKVKVKHPNVSHYSIDKTYAIPKVSEDKGDVWEEAEKEFYAVMGVVNPTIQEQAVFGYLKKKFTLTKI